MNRIKEVIKDRGIRMDWIAKQIDAHPSHLSMWIAEDRYPSQERLIKLARVLKVKVKDLYPNVKTRYTYILNEEK